MTIKKFDFTNILFADVDVFYEKIYPLYPREFLFGNDYEQFAFLVSANFILNPYQWECIRKHWNQKEAILSIEKK